MVSFPVAVLDCPSQSNLGEERFIGLTIPIVITGNQDSRNIGSFYTTATVRSKEQGVNSGMLVFSFLHHYLVQKFLPRKWCHPQVVALLTMINRIIPRNRPRSQSILKCPLLRLQMILDCVRLTIETITTIYLKGKKCSRASDMAQ